MGKLSFAERGKTMRSTCSGICIQCALQHQEWPGRTTDGLLVARESAVPALYGISPLRGPIACGDCHSNTLGATTADCMTSRARPLVCLCLYLCLYPSTLAGCYQARPSCSSSVLRSGVPGGFATPAESVHVHGTCSHCECMPRTFVGLPDGQRRLERGDGPNGQSG